MVDVRQERKTEGELHVELLLVRRAVGAEPEDVHLQLLHVLPRITHGTGLRRASRRIRLGIEIEEEPATFEVGKLHRVSILIRE